MADGAPRIFCGCALGRLDNRDRIQAEFLAEGLFERAVAGLIFLDRDAHDATFPRGCQQAGYLCLGDFDKAGYLALAHAVQIIKASGQAQLLV